MDEVLRDAADEGPLASAGAFCAAIAPVAGVWIAKVLAWPRPFWVQFYDPETIHFYAGLHLLRGLVPENVDNPGTPLQVVSALVAACTGATPARYEAFLAAAHFLGLLLTLGGAAIVFYGILKPAPPLVRVAGTWLYFCAPSALERLDIWSPEILYLPLGAAALASFMRWTRAPSRRWAMLSGVFAGLAVAAKFVFLPWAAALGLTLLIARRARDAMAASVGVMLGFVIGTLPVATEYGLIFRRLLFLSGTGHADQSWPELLATSTAWLFCVVAIVVLTALSFRRSHTLLTLFCVAVIVFSVIATARNPSFRYLLPAALALVALLSNVALPPRSQIAALIFAGALLAKSVADDLSAHRGRIEHGERTRGAIAALVPREAVVLYGWRAPVPSFALRVMTRDRRYLAEVARLYPREGYVDPWTGRVDRADWQYAVVGADDLRHLRQPFEPAGRVNEFLIVRRR